MKPIRVSVLRRHIESGQRSSRDRCPIALAIKEALITPYVLVDPASISINNHACYKPTEQMVGFIRRFDAGRRVGPFYFELTRKT